MLSVETTHSQTDATDRGRNLLTHSRMACAKTCLRKHYFAYELGIRRDRSSSPLRMGAAFHVGLDALGRGCTVEESAQEAIESYAVTPDWCTTDEDITDWCVEAEIVKRLVVGYAWRWADDGIQCVKTELAFDLPIVNPDTGASSRLFTRAGKIDKIARLPDGRLVIVEHKTCSEGISPGSDYWRRLRLDQQISLYMLAARDLGHDIVTVLYDVVRKPSIQPKLVRGKELKDWAATNRWYGEQFDYSGPTERETPAMYGARVAADLQSRPDFYFARQEIPRLEADLEEFKAELWQQAKTLRDCQKHGRWFRNTNACLEPYKCEYFDDICSNAVDLENGPPPGFVRLDYVHPELEELNHAGSRTAAPDEQVACAVESAV